MLKESEEKVIALSKEKEQLIKQRDSAFKVAHLWRSELAKARERVVISEAAVVRADKKVRVVEADAEARIKEAAQKDAAAVKDKQELWDATELQRFNILPLLEYCNFCCRSESFGKQKRMLLKLVLVPVSGESVVHHMATYQVNFWTINEGKWSDIQATDARIADVREIAAETEGSSLDIPVVSSPISSHEDQGANAFRQP
ncbi:switch-associated protein 70 [Tripterygium wilfordii]|uniref:Switch-associated protein 70 n=1 Tax=Tripterygium wilfordii TaxID=458696 RepID=A0A7J7DCL7_TRIWF|nr:switch-associated protein 70 [Tripterygium wilfordii]